MGWIISREHDGRTEYLRRITAQFVSWTINRDDARRYPTRADARAAVKGRGMTTVRAMPDDADAPES